MSKILLGNSWTIIFIISHTVERIIFAIKRKWIQQSSNQRSLNEIFYFRWNDHYLYQSTSNTYAWFSPANQQRSISANNIRGQSGALLIVNFCQDKNIMLLCLRLFVFMLAPPAKTKPFCLQHRTGLLIYMNLKRMKKNSHLEVKGLKANKTHRFFTQASWSRGVAITVRMRRTI